ncbi:cytochrome P450, partial [Mycena amicta]
DLRLGVPRHDSLRSKSAVDILTGPPSKSWIFGNLHELLLAPVYGQYEFRWLEDCGPVYTLRGCFGESRVMVSDPAGVRFIVNGDAFVWAPGPSTMANTLFGHGSIFLARGDRHKHLRAIMNPWFSQRSVREMLPTMKEIAQKLVDRWDSEGVVGNCVDISQNLHTASLDMPGESLLEVPLKGLADQSNLSRIQRDLLDGVAGASAAWLLALGITPYIPEVIFSLAMKLPFPAARKFRDYWKVTGAMSRALVREKRFVGEEREETFVGRLATGTHNQCTRNRISSYTNAASNGLMSEDEIAVHGRTMLIAGDDTTGNTLAWARYRLAKMPKYQAALREEVQKNRLDANSDYDAMPLLNALINVCPYFSTRTHLTRAQEVLRFYPAFPLAERVAAEDCVLPLSDPLQTTAGTVVTEIPVKKGQFVYIGIASYHRNKSFWGADADEFCPERWLAPDPPCKTKGGALGPHASLLSFFAGPSVCIGYRLAILEIQVTLAELLSNFTFTLPANDSVRPVLSITTGAQDEGRGARDACLY